MKDYLVTSALPFVGEIFSYALPHVLLSVTFLYLGMLFQGILSNSTPEWKDVALWAMGVVGALLGLAYRDFIRRLNKLETNLGHSRDSHNRSEKRITASLVTLALLLKTDSGTNQAQLADLIERLMESV